MQLKFLGTGTSQGVPVIGCKCPVCLSQDPKDQRFRCSVLITTDFGKKLLIDCGPDFRIQMLTQSEDQVDAVLVTHEHNDHIIGLDDLRPIIFSNGRDMPIYCNQRVSKEIRERFPYAFTEIKYPGVPSFDLHPIGLEPFVLEETKIIPIEIQHYKINILGFRIKNLAYITDASKISDEEKFKLKNLDFLIINCLRKSPKHISHFILPEVLDLFKELQPKKMYLTHISHEFGLNAVEETQLPANVHLAYDGLDLSF